MEPIRIYCAASVIPDEAEEARAWEFLSARFPDSADYFTPLRGMGNLQSRMDSLCVHLLLSRVLPQSVRGLCRESAGKPVCRAGDTAFSLTHADGFVLCAVSEENICLGIDAEPADRIPAQRALHMAGRFFSDSEAASVTDAESFLYLWTRKEAYVKYTGQGIRGDLRNVPTDDGGEVSFASYRVGKLLVALAYPRMLTAPSGVCLYEKSLFSF